MEQQFLRNTLQCSLKEITTLAGTSDTHGNKMLHIPYSTQFGTLANPTQHSQKDFTFNLIYLNDKLMTEEQIRLMENVKDIMKDKGYKYEIVAPQEVDKLAKNSKIFVIPYRQEYMINLIRSIFPDKPQIYTARCVVESLHHRKIMLPTRSVAVSLSMVNCKIFLVESCNVKEVRDKINMMCGLILAKFDQEGLNVVVTDRADRKYCAKARARNIAVVSTDWVDENYNISLGGDEHINHDALSNISAYQIKPFLGLRFKAPPLGKELRDLINRNGGIAVFGTDTKATHVVVSGNIDVRQQPESHDSSKPRIVDESFLHACDQSGYYLNVREYRKFIRVKQEPISQAPQRADSLQASNCMTPPQMNPRSTLSSIRSNNLSMPPPSSILSRPGRQLLSNEFENIIMAAIDSCDNATQHTQIASTQMRGLPESAIKFEQTPEMSQHLFWSDSNPKKHDQI